MAELIESWVEILFLILFVIGLVVALSIKNVFLIYLITLLTGMICGRLFFYRKRTKHTHEFSFYFIISGFLVGYIIGTANASKFFIIVFFILGGWLGYYIHKKGYIE